LRLNPWRLNRRYLQIHEVHEGTLSYICFATGPCRPWQGCPGRGGRRFYPRARIGVNRGVRASLDINGERDHAVESSKDLPSLAIACQLDGTTLCQKDKDWNGTNSTTLRSACNARFYHSSFHQVLHRPPMCNYEIQQSTLRHLQEDFGWEPDVPRPGTRLT
jgi:hypothetical protein